MKPGVYAMPATQQDVAPTLAAALGVGCRRPPPDECCRFCGPVSRNRKSRFSSSCSTVSARDYLDRYAEVLPTLVALRRSGAWFSQAQVNFLPSNTAVGHTTIATGADPRFHGITGQQLYDRVTRDERSNCSAGMRRRP